MKTLTYSDLEDIHFEHDCFKKIIEISNGKYYWIDIMYAFKIFCEKHDKFYQSFPNYFYLERQLAVLDKLGIDYNYIDAGGNNFFQFVMGCTYRDKEPKFNEIIYPLIEKNTDNIYHVNKFDRHVLFDMLSFSKAGLNGEQFFDFLKRYPNFNLHQVDKGGKNLLHHCLIQSAPFSITQYLIENNVSIQQIDKDGHNLLNLFSLVTFQKSHKKLFSQLLLELDVSQEDRWGKNVLTYWAEFITSEKVHSESKNTSIEWLKFTLSQINQHNFYHNEENLPKIICIIENLNEQLRPHLIEYYSDHTLIDIIPQTLVSLRALKLDKELSINEGNKNRLKI